MVRWGGIVAIIAVFLFSTCISAKEGFGPGEQDYGYVKVRKGAHMFYWLYYTTANVSAYTDRPLAIWLQGGPGASSTGYGNFEELGPLTLSLKPRNHTWVKDMNVLFIDNPVGSGFSYVDNVIYLTKSNKQIALDLVELMKGFYNLHPEFKSVPLHIFCESYGGKMAPEFALYLYKAIQNNEIESNLQSVSLGDPWVSPVDSVNAWAPLLLNMGIIDNDGYNKIMKSANETEVALDNGKYTQSTLLWGNTQGILLDESKGVDFYNILLPTNGEAYTRSMLSTEDRMFKTLVNYDIDEDRDQILQDLMRGPVSKALNIPSNVVWGSQSGSTFTILMGDFMKPVVDVVETLLNSTTLKVSVFSGQLDLICATPGTVNWINKMNWINKTEYESAPRKGIVVNRILEGYQKEAGNFSMFWVDRAGHMVPNDNPRAMDFILKKYTKYDQNASSVSEKEGFGPGEQDYGYVDVRKGAHMFYWLYYTTANVSAYTDRPLAIWLQGGPGASSTGYGNFEELGPLTLSLKPRNHTWVKDMNVLFIDNPVGSGFSYVDDIIYLTESNKQIALDLVEFMKGFYNLHPEFKSVPLHIFCESYGGKMAPEFALYLYKAIQNNEIESNLQSVSLGDPWVSPIDSVNAWAPLVLNMGIIDNDGYNKIMKSANETEVALDNGKYTHSTLLWGNTQGILLDESKGVDFYNILLPTNGEAYTRYMLSTEDRMFKTLVNYDIDEDRDQILQDLMRGPVSKALNIPSNVVWGSQSGSTFNILREDFMKPVVDIVETLLNSTTLKVSVFSGQLDLICATPGTVNWINKMNWINKTEYESAPRKGIVVNRILEGYQKEAGNFSMFWVDRAGHMVPNDNPRAMDFILKKYTKYDQTVSTYN